MITRTEISVVKYSHFELKNIAVLKLFYRVFLVIWNSLNKCRIGGGGGGRGRWLLTFLSQMRRLFEGGA